MSNRKGPEPASRYPAPREDPLVYPGPRPDTSFVLSGGIVFPVTLPATPRSSPEGILYSQVVRDEASTRVSIDEFLKQRGAATLRDRFAVIGYGSNPVPGQLLSKFGDDSTVPVLFGELRNTDVVYNLISNLGYAFAELILDQVGVNSLVGITFLDDRQLRRMIETEQNYCLAFSPADISLENGEILKGGTTSGLYLFVGFRRVWVPKQLDQPVPIAELPSPGRRRQAMTQSEVLQLVIQDFGLEKHGIRTPLELARCLREESTWPEKPPKLKYYLQSKVEEDPKSLPSLASQVALVSDTTRGVASFSAQLRQVRLA